MNISCNGTESVRRGSSIKLLEVCSIISLQLLSNRRSKRISPPNNWECANWECVHRSSDEIDECSGKRVLAVLVALVFVAGANLPASAQDSSGLLGQSGLAPENQGNSTKPIVSPVDDDRPITSFNGLLEIGAPLVSNDAEVLSNEEAARDLRVGSRSDDTLSGDSLAEMFNSKKRASDSVVVKNASGVALGQTSPAVELPAIGKRPASTERVQLGEEPSSTEKVSNVRQAVLTKAEQEVARIADAPLIDEPLGSGLASPIVTRGGTPPPPVLLQRLPPPSREQEVYEVLPEPIEETRTTEEWIIPSDGSDDGSSAIWVETNSPPTHTHARSRRHRMMNRLSDRLEPLRPINLCDRGLYFATEFTFLSSSGIARSHVEVTDLLTDVDHCVESEGAFGYGQRGILGLQGEVFGFELIYWDYGSRGYESGSWKPPYLFEQYTTGQSVDLSTLDLEVTQKFCVAGVNWGTAVGLRKMDYVGHSSAFSLATYHDQQVEVSSSALAKNRLEGIGPTFSIRGSRPFAMLCDGGAYGAGMFWDTRVSWLWSDSSSSAITEASAVSTTYGNPTVSRSLDYAYTISDDPELRMHTGLQLGFECWRSVGCRSRLISRAAFEYQYFEQSDDYSMASSYAFLTDSTNFGASSSALAENSGKDLNMFGFTLLVGINY